MATEKENTELVRRFYEDVYTKGETNLIPKIFGSGVTYQVNPSDSEMPLKGPKEIESLVRRYRTAFPDLKMKVEQTLAEGDHVAVRWTASGTHKGEFRGVKASNKRMTIPGISIFQVRNGLVENAWSHFDSARFLNQIGAVEMPKSFQSAPSR